MSDDGIASFDDGLGCNAVLGVVSQLDFATTVSLVDGALHRLGDMVGVHDDTPVEVACGASHGLCQRAVAAQEAFLVRIEDGHKRYLGQVEALAQKVDADKYVIDAGT